MLTLEWTGSSWSLPLVAHSHLLACPDMNQPSQSSLGLLVFLQASQGEQGSLGPGQSQRGGSRGQRQRSQLKAGGPAGKGASCG